ncbi:sensor histidine kinase [Comamonas composti]|uniref:sensor histidine kinase n=1 Tax=Comamonas composti TaxID=408558 RepID=UPI00040EB50E|nr:HAMP domain-containing sensor histidine kinase [Comamonas composti]
MAGISLKRRVLLGLTLAFAAGAGALALSLYDTRDQLRRATMLIQAQEIAAGFSMQSDPASLPKSYAGGELSYTLYSPQGQVLWFSENLKSPRRLRRALTDQTPSLLRWPWFRWPMHSGEVVNVPARLADGATLMVAKRDTLERQAIGNLLHAKLLQALTMLIPVGLLAFLLIYQMMRWTLKPVQEAARFAQGISPGNARPIPTDRLPRELLPLAQAVNTALEKLAQSLANEKRLVADSAHELRTPLTVLDLRLQKARAHAVPDWPAIDADMHHLRRVTDQLMLLARQDQDLGAGEASRANPQTHLSRLVREVAAAMLPLFDSQARPLHVSLMDGIRCRGDEDLLRTAISNVLENAFHHGHGDVAIAMSCTADTISLRIGDQGAGPPAESHERMFTRFQKGSPDSKGAGLGLAITRQVLRNAGGEARFMPGPGGCVVELCFARWQAAD